MAEEGTTVLAAPPGEDAPAVDAEKASKIIGEHGKFKDQNALVAGYANVESHASRVSAENAALKERMAQLERDAGLAERLDKLVDNTTPKPSETPVQTFEEFVAERRGAWADDPTLIASDLAEQQSDWTDRKLAKMEAQFKTELAARDARLSSLSENMAKSDKVYQENAPRVETLVKRGMSLEAAKETASEEAAERAKLSSDTMAAPAGLAPGRSAAPAGAPGAPQVYDSADDRASMKRKHGFDDAKLDEMERKAQERIKAGRAGQ